MIEREEYSKYGIAMDAWLDAWHTIWEKTKGNGKEKVIVDESERLDLLADLTTHFTLWDRRDCLVGQDENYFRQACPWETRIIEGLYPEQIEASEFISSILGYIQLEDIR